MKKWLILGALLACTSLLLSSALAEDKTPQSSESETLGFTPEEVKKIKEAIKRGQLDVEEPPLKPGGPARAPARPPLDPTGVEPEGKRLEELGKPREVRQEYNALMEGSGKLIYARPFVASPKAILGGYMDIEYINRDNDGKNSKFDQHRLVPFIYGDVSNSVKFAAEIEIEHGEELKVEFAVIDYLIDYLMVEPANLRAGILLLPLGKFNLLHDSPLRDLTERPLVNRRIIPTTLHQPGVGFYGTFYPTALSQLNYEIYLTSGFTNAFGGEKNDIENGISNINVDNGIRSARSNNTDFDNNQGKAWVGRIAFSPFLGAEIGTSGFVGNYGPTDLDRQLGIFAVDWTLQRGPWELIGESAWAWIGDNGLALDGTPVAAPPPDQGPFGVNQTNPDRMQGYFIQLNYHFLPQWMTDLFPNHFRQEVSTFTAVARWNQVFLNQGLEETEYSKRGDRQRLELGLNFRPTEDTVFKANFEYQPSYPGPNGTRIHTTGGIASIATYF
jgi:hypothetical protein